MSIYLQELIEALAKEDPDRVLPLGFRNPHSWRGIYAELAFEPATNVRVGDMLADALSAIGSTYPGWKGGDFTMNRYTEIHVSREGNSDETFWLDLLLAQERLPSDLEAALRNQKP